MGEASEHLQGRQPAGAYVVGGARLEWLRYQPESELSLWFTRRFAGGGKRLRRIGIVALARRLAIALWRYLKHGLIPQGAQLNPLVGRQRTLLATWRTVHRET